jgi:hypothetical protein
VDGPLVEAIDAARLSIDVAAYSLSLNSVRNALIHAHERGATVRVVMESTNMDRSDPQRLIEAGIPVIGDVITSTLLTLLVIPTVYEILADSRDWLSARFFGPREKTVHAPGHATS